MEKNVLMYILNYQQEKGFDSVRIKLPSYEVAVWEGNYSKEEMELFKKIVKSSSDLFYEYKSNIKYNTQGN